MYQVDNKISSDNELVQIFWGGVRRYWDNFIKDYHIWTKPKNISFVYFFVMGAGSGGNAGNIVSGLTESGIQFPSTQNTTEGGRGGNAGAIYQSFWPAYLVPEILYVKPGFAGGGGESKIWGQPTSGIQAGVMGEASIISPFIMNQYAGTGQALSVRNFMIYAQGGEQPTNIQTNASVGFNPIDQFGISLLRFGDLGVSGSYSPSTPATNIAAYMTQGDIPNYELGIGQPNAMNTGGAGGGAASQVFMTAGSGASVILNGAFSSSPYAINNKLPGGASGYLSDGENGAHGIGQELINTNISKLLSNYPICFTGGAGGGASVSGNGGDGGKGGPGCGGGGGGASWGPAGSRSGKGGDGGPGLIAIICV